MIIQGWTTNYLGRKNWFMDWLLWSWPHWKLFTPTANHRLAAAYRQTSYGFIGGSDGLFGMPAGSAMLQFLSQSFNGTWDQDVDFTRSWLGVAAWVEPFWEPGICSQKWIKSRSVGWELAFQHKQPTKLDRSPVQPGAEQLRNKRNYICSRPLIRNSIKFY